MDTGVQNIDFSYSKKLEKYIFFRFFGPEKVYIGSDARIAGLPSAAAGCHSR